MGKPGQFPGVYRGIVTNNLDPMQMVRVQITVPDVLAVSESPWARVTSPIAGRSRGLYFVPEVGDEVLVAFEGGDPQQPYVIGSLWNANDKPPTAAGANPPDSVIAIQGKAQHAVVIRDTPSGGIEIRSAGGAVISVSDAAITINNGKGASVILEGSSVTVNGKWVPR